MTESQTLKYLVVTPPAAVVDNASLVTAEIDCAGAHRLDVLVIVGATDIPLTALKLQETDVSGVGLVDIAGAAYGTATHPFPIATDDNKIFAFSVDLLGRKRYIDVVATIGDGAAGAFVTIVAVLSQLRETPSNAAQRGFANQLFV